MISVLAQQAAEDAEGFIEHNGDVLDIFMLVAMIVFIGAAGIAWAVQPRNLWATVLSIGLAAASFALLFL
jgi:hypothetical protein